MDPNARKLVEMMSLPTVMEISLNMRVPPADKIKNPHTAVARRHLRMVEEMIMRLHHTEVADSRRLLRMAGEMTTRVLHMEVVDNKNLALMVAVMTMITRALLAEEEIPTVKNPPKLPPTVATKVEKRHPPMAALKKPLPTVAAKRLPPMVVVAEIPKRLLTGAVANLKMSLRMAETLKATVDRLVVRVAILMESRLRLLLTVVVEVMRVRDRNHLMVVAEMSMVAQDVVRVAAMEAARNNLVMEVVRIVMEAEDIMAGVMMITRIPDTKGVDCILLI